MPNSVRPKASANARNRRVAGADPEKRRQILDGALAVFMAQGFDAASMSGIAAAASVSKGTLYVYFQDKEHLFVALIEREREAQKRALLQALSDGSEMSDALMRYGEALAKLLTHPFAVSAHRIVIGVAERMPDLGQEFYRNDPALGAQHFLDLCQSTLVRPRLFNAEREAPSDERIRHVVAEALKTFLARYGVR